MLKIGEFASLGKVSIKALHHYGELGLLRPARIDRYTGYRYYQRSQLPQLFRILALKGLGFSLEQVGQLLDDDLPAAELRGMLRMKQMELTRQIRQDQLKLAKLSLIMGQLEQGELAGLPASIPPLISIEDSKMKPTFVTKPAFDVVGLSYVGKNEHSEIPAMWQQFLPRIEEPGRAEPDVAYGVCISHGEGLADGKFEYVAGVEVRHQEPVPDGMVRRHIPQRKYARFTHHGPLDKLGETYQAIYDSWLPNSGMELDDMFDMEEYTATFEPGSPDSEMYIYVAVK